MKNNIVQVAAVVPKIKVADVRYNTDQIIESLNKLSDCGVIVFPELSVTGYTCADLFLSDLILEEAKKALIQIAKETLISENTVIIGAPIRFENSIYNCAAILSGGSIKALIPKTYERDKE